MKVVASRCSDVPIEREDAAYRLPKERHVRVLTAQELVKAEVDVAKDDLRPRRLFDRRGGDLPDSCS